MSRTSAIWPGEKRFFIRPMARLIQEHIKRPLAEELLFGKLVNGGHVEVSLSDDGEKMVLPPSPIAGEFSREDLVSAIRGAQADTIRYPEFMKRSAAAGVIAYWAFLQGSKVIYFGRKGEFHIEEFPRAQS